MGSACSSEFHISSPCRKSADAIPGIPFLEFQRDINLNFPGCLIGISPPESRRTMPVPRRETCEATLLAIQDRVAQVVASKSDAKELQASNIVVWSELVKMRMASGRRTRWMICWCSRQPDVMYAIDQADSWFVCVAALPRPDSPMWSSGATTGTHVTAKVSKVVKFDGLE